MRRLELSGNMKVIAMNPRTVCAWCGLVMREGPEPTTHGICPPCAERFEAEGADFAHDNKPQPSR